MHAYYVFSWIMKFFTHGVGVEAFKLDWEGGGGDKYDIIVNMGFLNDHLNYLGNSLSLVNIK